jgi:hypothetical protein
MPRMSVVASRPLRSWFVPFCLAMATLGGQVPAQSTGGNELLIVQRVAGRYPVLDVTFFGTDSALVEVQDSSRTVAAVLARTWTFGPPVSAEDAAGCPPEKVLGRRIARALWRVHGKTLGVTQIVVRVHGSSGLDRMSYADMYYGIHDLGDPWTGDRP